MRNSYSGHLRKVALLLVLLLAGTAARVWAQAGGTDISGKVTDEQGMALPGVTVQVKGTTVGANTEANGTFRLRAPAGASALVFSFVGYAAQTLEIGSRRQFNLTLREDAQALNDVVVVGYGTQKKSQLTGAISSVTSKEIAELPVTNARQALQGRAAGVDVIQSGSQPGAA